MEDITLKPEKELKTIWFTIWFIVFAIGLAGCFILLIAEEPIAFGIVLGVWCILNFPYLFWIPAFYRSLEYTITEDSIKSKRGVFWKKQTIVPYPKITNIDITQGPLERKYNIGTIHVQTAGAGGAQGALAELKMSGLREHEKLKDIIMEKVSGYKTQ